MWILSAAFVAILLRIFGKIIRRLLQMEREREFTISRRKAPDFSRGDKRRTIKF